MEYLDMKKVLKELDKTDEELSKMWSDLYTKNFIVKNLTDHGKTWRDLNPYAIKSMITEYDKKQSEDK